MKAKTLLSFVTIAMAATAIAYLGQEKNAVETRAAYSQGSVIPAGKARVWVGYDTGNPFTSYATEMKLWIHQGETGKGAGEHIYTLSGNGGSFNNGAESNRRYDYFDIDETDYTNGWYLSVQKFQDGNWKATTNSIQLSSANAFQVYYVWGDWAWDKTQGTVAAGSIDSVDAGLAAKALAGMHACNSSAINGYNAFPNFNSTFVKDGENWKTSGNLSDYEITDYPYKSDYTGNPSETVNAYTKYVAVENMYKTGKISGAYNVSKFGGNDVNGAAVIGGLAVFGVAAAGTMIFFAKRRKEI